MSISGIGPRGAQLQPEEPEPARHALGRALLNDPKGVVDERDAKRIVGRALAEIRRARDPEKAFESIKPTIAAARDLTERGAAARDAKKVLASYEPIGAKVVAERLAKLTGEKQLHLEARDGLVSLLRDHEIVSGSAPIKISNVKGDARAGFEVDYASGRTKGKAFVTKVGGEWFYAPQKVDRRTLDLATDAFRKYFDDEWAPELRDMGASAAEVREARAKLLPTHALFPGEEDPQGYVNDYPLVLQFRNETGSDHGCYAGVNPATGEVSVYTFN